MTRERCECCRRVITNKMKDNQQIIYASAEHTLSAPSKDVLIDIGDTDIMFGGVYCCYNCYAEHSGINSAARNIVREIIKIVDDKIRFFENFEEDIKVSDFKKIKKRINRLYKNIGGTNNDKSN